MKMTDFLTSNLINALSLEPKVKIEASIVSVRPREFEDGTTKAVIYLDFEGKGVVLNQTRLKALIAAFGTSPNNLIGKTVIISRGMTKYQGRDVPCVDIEPVVADRIGTIAKLARDAGIRGGGDAWDEAPSSDPDDPGAEPNEDIPF
jgi:hypothetical protein